MMALWALVWMMASAAAWGQRQEVSKTIDETYPASASDRVLLSNKYGDVVVNTWSRQEVSVKVEIKGWGPSEEAAERMLERVSVAYGKSGADISFTTEISSSSINISDRSGFEVNYTVNMPGTLFLGLENKFGMVSLADFAGPLELEVGYGQLQAGELTGKGVQVAIKYSKGSIEHIADGSLECRYSGNVTLGKAGTLQLSDKYGSVAIGEAREVNADIAYSGLKIDRLTGSLVLESRYSGSSVKEVAAGFGSIEVDNAYGSFTAGFAEKAGFSFEVGVRFGNFKSLPGTDWQTQVERPTSGEYSGRVGQGNGVVRVESAYGNVKFQ
jgi:hypothetical protein